MRSVDELKKLQSQIQDDERVSLVHIEEDGTIHTDASFTKEDEIKEFKKDCINVNDTQLLALPFCDAIIISKRVLHRKEVQTTLKRWMI